VLAKKDPLQSYPWVCIRIRTDLNTLAPEILGEVRRSPARPEKVRPVFGRGDLDMTDIGGVGRETVLSDKLEHTQKAHQVNHHAKHKLNHSIRAVARFCLKDCLLSRCLWWLKWL